MPIGRLPVILVIVFAAALGGCPSTSKVPESSNGDGTADTGPKGGIETEPEKGGEGKAVYVGDDYSVYAPEGFGDFFEDLQILLGGDRKPARALQKIRATHDLKDWSYRPGVEDAVEVTRDAVGELARSDYRSWEETGLVLTVLSTMAVRDRAAVVRVDCLSTLTWFRDWIFEDAARLDAPVATTEAAVISALKVLDEVARDTGPAADTKRIQAIGILGCHPWYRLESERAAIARSALSRPRGVIRRLSRPDLTARRENPEVAEAIDRALVRVSDQAIVMTMVAALADRTAYVRAAAAKALATARDPRAVGAIIHAVEGETRDFVKQELVPALGRCSLDKERQRAVPALAELLMDTDVTVRQAAARELDRLTGAGLGVDPAAWLRWWKVHARDYGRR